MANSAPPVEGTPAHGSPAQNGSLDPNRSGAHTAPIKRAAGAGMMLTALGVVFGDIGTSPLYTLKECVLHASGGATTFLNEDLFSILSLMFWSLVVVVTIKYLFFIMRCDNKGEGGIMALLALLPEHLRARPLAPLSAVAVLVVIGASFLYGDGAITPAISVLSAVEGITVAKPGLQAWVIPITLGLLIALFAIQSRGTALIGRLFGPVMVLWFGTLAVLGAWHIVQAPAILQALSPHYALAYFAHHGAHGVIILGSVVLTVTGGEALYADMGHFGLAPIRRAWLFFVLPALVLAYFGQGALLLRDPGALENPFFRMVPAGGATFALVVLSSFATIIASQALISGSFSLTRQAMQMGLFPRVTVKHTAADQEGQIYIPEVNAALAVVCVLLVLEFRSASAMAAVYGVAVTGTMTITSIVYLFVLIHHRNWPRWRAWALVALFLFFDLPFVVGNAFKIPHGGWVPLFLGLGVVVIMLVWHQGRQLVGKIYSLRYPSFEAAWGIIQGKVSQRVGGVGIFMASADQGVPPILMHIVDRMRALHKEIILLTVVTLDVPKVENRDRLEVKEIGHGFWRVHVRYGFMEQPHVPRALELAVKRRWLDIDLDDLTYFLARERILARPGGEMNVVFERFFSFLSRNAVNADRYFQIPAEKVIEVGAQIDL
ncbi:MAG: KUP/HAK/KT family potassium transporter [Deltaproteobacteria bacterium]|nr:KUP/HAK/KT family potassium transporter [Deltaproteobacteria bacterium]